MSLFLFARVCERLNEEITMKRKLSCLFALAGLLAVTGATGCHHHHHHDRRSQRDGMIIRDGRYNRTGTGYYYQDGRRVPPPPPPVR